MTDIPDPDWESFGRAILENWPDSGVDGWEIQNLAVKYHLFLAAPGGFNPLVDIDPDGIAEKGDPWFLYNF